ncbi:hypothetical protein L0152_10660 [bacterium]|nr:hypothetical protein [bacterium]
MFGMLSGKSFKDEKVEREQKSEIRDLLSGDLVEIHNPDSYELETVLVNSAYYKYLGKEFRFLLCQARESGLKIA